MTDRDRQAMTPLHHALQRYAAALDHSDVLSASNWARDARQIVEDMKKMRVTPPELDPLLQEAAVTDEK